MCLLKSFHLWPQTHSVSRLVHINQHCWPVAAGAKHFLGGRNKLKVRVICSLILFFLHPNALWTGIFVKIKPNVLWSGDIALASTLISTCLSTDELLLSGTRIVENGPITWGQTHKNNIDSLEQQKWEEPAPQGQFETSQSELSLKSHAFEKFVYLHTHSLVQYSLDFLIFNKL